MNLAPCRLLEWDSDFFGFRIARVQGDTLTEPQMLRADAWNRKHRIRCAYFLSRADHPETLRVVERHGFSLVDIRVSLEWNARLTPQPAASKPADAIRPVRAEEVSFLKELARKAHTGTRFFSDIHFPREKAEALYSAWIGLECEGRAQKVLVSVSPVGELSGYCSLHFNREQRRGEIGLFAVHDAERRKGIGTSLVLASLDWLARQGAQSVCVVTQGHNLPALRLYQRCGFLTRELQLWYHQWYPEPEDRKH